MSCRRAVLWGPDFASPATLRQRRFRFRRTPLQFHGTVSFRDQRQQPEQQHKKPPVIQLRHLVRRRKRQAAQILEPVPVLPAEPDAPYSAPQGFFPRTHRLVQRPPPELLLLLRALDPVSGRARDNARIRVTEFHPSNKRGQVRPRRHQQQPFEGCPKPQQRRQR